ncbi:MAG: methyltransferase [Actinomycetia bacterium]|nr:methyltransferase [Actinomycetes bacterium]
MSQDPAAVEGVGATALGAAMMRAQESSRSDRLFDDPYAASFVAAAPPPFEDVPDAGDGELAALEAAFRAAMVVRTCFFDEYLVSAVSSGCRQVVLLAAGLDTRAFRLAWPQGTRLFELDLPEVFTFKEAVLSRHGADPGCERTIVAVDLRHEWPSTLREAGFDPTVPTAWTAEGLLAYLTHEEAARLLTDVGELSAAGSQLAFEQSSFASDSVLDDARNLQAMEQVSSMWKGGLNADAAAWLEPRGWEVHALERSEVAAKLGRHMPGESAGGFLTATRDASSGRTAP